MIAKTATWQNQLEAPLEKESDKADKASDRLIASIAMVKDVLQSNMELRQDQVKLTKEHETALVENHQLRIENEDLRDKLHMITKNLDYSIDYQAYLPLMDLESLLSQATSAGQLESLKTVILTYIFSLRKENRQLHKRLNDRQFIENPVHEAERQAERKYLRDEEESGRSNYGLTKMTDYKRPAIGEGIANFAEY